MSSDITGMLTGTDAVTVTQGLETLADQLFHRYRKDREANPDTEIPNRAQLLAEALTHAVRLALSRDVHSTTPARIEATIITKKTPTPSAPAPPTGQVTAPLATPMMVTPTCTPVIPVTAAITAMILAIAVDRHHGSGSVTKVTDTYPPE